MTSSYQAWQAIKGRCHSPTHAAYADYGGRGITMHEPWRESFELFTADLLAEVGPRPSRAYSLDRIDNNGHYEPGNVRWATMREQNGNRRITRYYTFDGQQKSLADWARSAGVTYELVKSRVLTYKWPLAEALGTPPGAGRCPVDQRRAWSPKKEAARVGGFEVFGVLANLG